MSKSDIIEQIVADANYRNLCNRIDKAGDLYQNFIVWLLEMPEKKLISLYETPYFKYCMVRVITQKRKLMYVDEAWYERARFVGGFDGYDISDTEYNHDIDTIAGKVEQVLHELPVCDSGFSYEKELFTASLEIKSLRELSRQTGISYKSIRRSIHATTDHIRSKVQNPAGRTA